MTRRAAVVGSPIAHSLSPAIHNAGYAAAGLSDWTYTAHECGKDTLASFLDSLGPEWAGLSVTMPLKERALALADSADDTATALGAANTLVFGEGGRVAYNTDAPGMVDALAEVGMRHASRVAILGAGGTARAALGGGRELVGHVGHRLRPSPRSRRGTGTGGPAARPATDGRPVGVGGGLRGRRSRGVNHAQRRE